MIFLDSAMDDRLYADGPYIAPNAMLGWGYIVAKVVVFPFKLDPCDFAYFSELSIFSEEGFGERGHSEALSLSLGRAIW